MHMHAHTAHKLSLFFPSSGEKKGASDSELFSLYMQSLKVILWKKFSLKTAVIKQWLKIPAAGTAEKQLLNFSLFC